jgi:sarcosine oxidase
MEIFRDMNQFKVLCLLLSFFVVEATNSLLYGFPELEWANPGYIRVATDFPDNKIIYHPSERHLATDEDSLQVTLSWVEQFMPGFEPTSHFKALV